MDYLYSAENSIPMSRNRNTEFFNQVGGTALPPSVMLSITRSLYSFTISEFHRIDSVHAGKPKPTSA